MLRNPLEMAQNFADDVDSGRVFASEKAANLAIPAAAGVIIGTATALAPDAALENAFGATQAFAPLFSGAVAAAFAKAGLSMLKGIEVQSDFEVDIARVPVLAPTALTLATIVAAFFLTRNPSFTVLVTAFSLPYFYAKTVGQLTGMTQAAINRIRG